MEEPRGKRSTSTWKRPIYENIPWFTQSNTQTIINWKTSGYDGIHGFWFKNSLPSMTDWLSKWIDALKMQIYSNGWQRKGLTLIQKDPLKGTATNNYRPITCLLIMWQILTAQIREEIYNLLVSRRLFLEGQKGCRKGTRGTGELLYIDNIILKESKTIRKM